MTDVDVLVVGGGPAGLATAIEARLAGMSVALVESREGVVDKACGEGLMPGALPALARLGVDPPGRDILGVRYVQNRTTADHRFRSGRGRGVRRTVLHEHLTARARELGVEFVTAQVKIIEQNRLSVTAADITASWLLAADGLHSTVRTVVGPDAGAPRRNRRFGQRQHFFAAPSSDLIEVHWTPDAEVYITPVSDDVTGVAILGKQGMRFADALASVPALAHLSRAEPASSLRGAGPFRQRATAPSSGRVLLVGDASGYVDAITGEGLRLGFAQARAAVAACAAGDPRRYDTEWREITRDFRRVTSGLVTAATSPVRRAIVPVAKVWPGLYGSLVESLAR